MAHLEGLNPIGPRETEATLSGAVLRNLTDLEGKVYAIDPAYSDTAEFSEKYNVHLNHCANTIVTASGKGECRKFSLCIVPASMKLDTKPVQALRGGRTSFARPEDAARVTGMEFGAITPMGLLDRETEQIPILAPPELFETDWIVLGAGVRELKIVVSPNVLRQFVNVVDGLAIAK